MDEYVVTDDMNSPSPDSRPTAGRMAKEALFFLAVLGLYFLLSSVVLPRLGFNT